MIRLKRENEERERKELEAATKYAMEQEKKEEIIKKRDEELRKEEARQRQILTDVQTAYLAKLRVGNFQLSFSPVLNFLEETQAKGFLRTEEIVVFVLRLGSLLESSSKNSGNIQGTLSSVTTQ